MRYALFLTGNLFVTGKRDNITLAVISHNNRMRLSGCVSNPRHDGGGDL